MYLLYKYWLSSALEHTWADKVLQVLDQLAFRASAAAIVAFVLVIVCGRPVIRWLQRQKIGDAGLTDAAALTAVAGSKRNVPTMGGILIVGSIILSTLLFADFVFNNYVILGLVTLVWMAALGGIDDWLKLTASKRPGASRQGLFAWEKLAGQFGCALLVAFFAFRYGAPPPPSTRADLPDASPQSLSDPITPGALARAEAANPQRSLSHVLNLPGQKTFITVTDEKTNRITRIVNPSLWYLPLWVFVPLGVFVIAGISNAVNISDGMDGLAAGTTTVVSIGLMLLALVAGTAEWANTLLVPHVAGCDDLGVMAGAMAGACLGFLWFNCAPASVFMGDTGALALGGLVGYIAMVARQEIVVLFMCGVLLVELGSVALQVGYFRLSGGKRIFKVAPYHHHLHLCDWKEQQVVVRFWIVTVLLVVVGLASIKLR
ncbi:phospho-N-acetylmuramoyl-pentapeptide-transferase [soil metagenome]